MEVYLRVKNNLFYRIRTKEVFAINTDCSSFRRSKALPSSYVEDVTVITKKEFNEALKKIGLDEKFN